MAKLTCHANVPGRPAVTPARCARKESPMPSPEAIYAQVRAPLEHEPRINLQRYPIHLRYEHGILTVEGEVEDIVAKKLTRELPAVPGVDGVVDRLRVAPAERWTMAPSATTCAMRCSRNRPLRPLPSR